jgi:hypothetical protein
MCCFFLYFYSMAKILRLSPDFSDYHAFGISTHSKDYKLCWHINKSLQIGLKKQPDINIHTSEERLYRIFYQEEAFEHIDIMMISNFCSFFPLVPKLKHFHYFFIVRGKPLQSQRKKFLTVLKEIPQVLLVSQLKEAETTVLHSVFADIELHITDIAKQVKEKKKEFLPKLAPIKKSK